LNFSSTIAFKSKNKSKQNTQPVPTSMSEKIKFVSETAGKKRGKWKKESQ